MALSPLECEIRILFLSDIVAQVSTPAVILFKKSHVQEFI